MSFSFLSSVPEPEKLDNHTAANITDKIGSVYTRWGRTVCDSDSALIYSGLSFENSDLRS